MKAVVLDGYTASRDDLDWKGLEEVCECEIYPRTDPEQTIDRIGEAEIVLTNKVIVDQAVMDSAPRLKYVGVLATGYNVVNLAAAKSRDITVTNVPAYSTASVAQAVFALLLELTNQTGLHNEEVGEGGWVNSKDFMFTASPLVELQGLKMGILGLGTIGKAVAEIALAMGMEVQTTVRTPRDTGQVQQVDLDELFRSSDVLSLHCPLSDSTHEIINAKRLAQMKSTAFLINTARGPLIDEAALAQALNGGEIAGAGLDVLSSEPPSAENPLLSAKNCIITPHNAWATRASRARLMKTAIANVKAFIAGTPQNQVG